MATTLLALRRGSSVLRKIECTILNSSRTLRAQVIKQKTWTKIGVSGTFLFLFYNQLPMSFAEPAGDSSDAAPAGGGKSSVNLIDVSWIILFRLS